MPITSHLCAAQVPSCELLHSGAAQSVVAGTPYVLTIRARDRFGNETANVAGSNVGFGVDLKRKQWSDAAGSPGGAASPLPTGHGAGSPGMSPGSTHARALTPD